ncbi:MAG: 3-deoxy-7-phosphoheptulonate synthase [Fimbriimonas ginsengisoli]|uniref:3-deoxy-7-phosphoheptulonate synthase n=1 Tax=Fimbriimonas ginsengisoli TaxID=1005039 RepID=A0A931PT25_FIMGI|nr:3-deoxy-7-phosphoheptulonate synthase [Fimbriimonas ginsengisoli]
MIIVMQFGASQAQIDAVCEVLRSHGVEPLVLPGEDRLAIGVPAALDPGKREHLETVLGSLDGVSKITQTSSPYKLASIEFHRDRTTVRAKRASVGPGAFAVIGGPCSVESYEQFSESARVVKASGATLLRGGAFKPRTSPYSFQGLQEEGLRILKQVGDETGLATVSEVMSGEMVPLVAEFVDVLQIGARSMQNFPLLVEAGRSKKPVFLKRGPSATIDEFLLAAEYVLGQGNPNVILCERGVMPLDRSYTRNTLDLSAVPVLKEHTHLPVVIDPSHGTGVARYVPPMAKAALVAGADGVMIEMHPDPKNALSDGSQALNPAQFEALMGELRALAGFLGLRMPSLA